MTYNFSNTHTCEMHLNAHNAKIKISMMHNVEIGATLRGRSQLSTFMKAYTAYARGRGSGTTVRFFARKSTFNFNH